jgi:hypothetical protein
MRGRFAVVHRYCQFVLLSLLKAFPSTFPSFARSFMTDPQIEILVALMNDSCVIS